MATTTSVRSRLHLGRSPRRSTRRTPSLPGVPEARRHGLRSRRGEQSPGVVACQSNGEVQRLMEENASLKKRIAELEAFLDGKGEAGNAFSIAEPRAPVAEPEPEVAVVDFDAIPLPSPEKPFWESVPVPTASSSDQPAGTERDPFQLSVVHLTAEMAPLAKVGGLGDVVTGLARSCTSRGHNVEIILPFYECIDEALLADLSFEFEYGCPKGHEWDGSFQVGELKTQVYTATCEGIKLILLRPDWDACNIFRGGGVYAGSYNETEAYLYFCRAGLEFLARSGRQPDIIHLHEWQTSAAAMLFWEVYNNQGLHKPRICLTIHNMDNTGECRAEEFGVTGESQHTPSYIPSFLCSFVHSQCVCECELFRSIHLLSRLD